MVFNIKELFPEYVVFIKIGTFFECYNNDSCIMSYLFKYKIKTLSSSDTVCGFPVSSINKVKYVLENKSIKRNKNLYENNSITFNKYISSYICYKNLLKQ